MHRKNTRAIQIIVFAVAVGLLAFLSANSFMSAVGSFFYGKVFGPVLEMSSEFAGAASDFFIGESKFLRLEEENRELLMRVADSELLKKENDALRRALGLAGEKGRRVLPVTSAGFFRVFGNEIIVINKGLESGIRNDDTVLTEDNVYVGRVLKAGDGRSDVILASSRSQIIDITLTGSGLRARASGLAGGEFAIDFVPKEAPLEEGELFSVSPKIAEYGSGMILGRVLEATSPPSGIFKNIRAAHLFSPLKTPPLFVILSET